ncbi:MAG TPA: ion channel [Nitrospirota bacterium]|nr:ion channel [Nitrospirota bacterium]
MIDRKYNILQYLWDAKRGPYGLLVVTVLTVFVISPLVATGMLDPLIVDAFVVVFMFAGVLTVHPHYAVRYLVLILAALAVLLRIASKIIPGASVTISQAMMEAAAIGLFAALVMKQFLVSERPPSHRICAAIMVYLFLGIMWARLYEIAGVVIPGAFHMDGGSATITSYLYFSFITLTTIGYGDILPVHPIARNLAVVEAITGQMYIAILIARLVSTTSNGQKG